MTAAVETMAYTNEVPWHGLGVAVGADMSALEMMVAAGCDWEVAKFDTFFRTGPQGKAGTVTGKTGLQALVRLSDHQVLSPNVGRDWEPLQNRDAFEFFHEFVTAGKMTMETAGSLKDGRNVWALAKVGESFEVFGGDLVESYLLFSNSHRYGESIKVDFTPIRVVCNNTLTLALKSKSKRAVTVNHRTAFDPEQVKELMGIASAQLDTYKEAALVLGKKHAKEEQVVEYFKAIFPVHAKSGEAKREISKLASQAMLVHETAPGAQYATGTWWHAYNSVTYMVDHVLCKAADTRLFNSWLGSTRQTKVDALELALKQAA